MEKTILYRLYQGTALYSINIGSAWYRAMEGRTDAIRAKSRRELAALEFVKDFLEAGADSINATEINWSSIVPGVF